MSESKFDIMDFLNRDPTIFKDESFFEPNYIPDRLIHRKEELILLASHFKSIIYNKSIKSGKQVVIRGSVGQGKTIVAKQFGNTIEEFCHKNPKQGCVKLLFLHMNCRRQRSWYLILTSILRQLVPAFPIRGFSTEELLTYLIKILEEKREALLLCLDEIDYLLSDRSKEQDILYSLIRHHEGLNHQEGAHISLILITRNPNFQDMLDITIRSSLAQQIIVFKPYTPTQLFDILSLRARQGLQEGTFSDEIITHIVDLTFRNGDARFAIELLWRSAKIAEKEGAKKINFDHIRKAKVSIFPIKQTIVTELSPQNKNVLLALALLLEGQETSTFVTTIELRKKYDEICKEKRIVPRKQTQFWTYLRELAKLGLIELKIQNQHYDGKSAGRTSLITISDLPVNELVFLLQ